MFAVAVTTYCKLLACEVIYDIVRYIKLMKPLCIFCIGTCSRTFLKQTHWFHFFNLVAICFYGVSMLLLLVWKPLEGGVDTNTAWLY